MKNYELTIIANPDMDYCESNDKIETIINKYHCEVEQKWYDGKKRLAYPILNYKYGIYVSYDIKIPQENVSKLSEELNITDCVLRYLLVQAMIEEIEFAQRIGTTVKLHLKEEDGSFKNHYHRYKTEEKAEHMYQIFRKAIGEK